MILAQGTLSSTDAVIFTGSSKKGLTDYINADIFYNAHTGDAGVNLFVVPNGETKGEQHRVASATIVHATKTSFEFDMKAWSLNEGDKIWASSDVDGVVNYTLFGEE